MIKGILYLAIVLMTIPLSCTVDPEAEKAEIATVIDHSISWFKDKDFTMCYAVLVNDSTLFMYQPTSDATIRGFDQFRKFSEVWKNPEVRYLRHEITDLKIHLGPSGDVAWFSAMLEDCSVYKGKEGCWKDTRWTGVLIKQHGKWALTQMHFSVARDKVVEEVKEKLRQEK